MRVLGVVVGVDLRHGGDPGLPGDAPRYHDSPRFPTPVPGPPRSPPGTPTVVRRARSGRGRSGRRAHDKAEPATVVAGSVAGGPISRVLSAGDASRRRPRLIISLGRASPHASSGQPGDGGGPGKPFLPIGPCTGWGLPSCPCRHGHWCALTAPFHPYPAADDHRWPCGGVRRSRNAGSPAKPTTRPGGLLSVARAVALRAQPLAGILPCGARTFLRRRRRSRRRPRSGGPPCAPRVARSVGRLRAGSRRRDEERGVALVRATPRGRAEAALTGRGSP